MAGHLDLTRCRRQPRRQAVVACVLWIVFAAVVWNVVFDRLLVLAGRRYVYAAAVAFDAHQPPVLVDPWMRAAQSRAIRVATLVAIPIALLGTAAVVILSGRVSRRRD